MSLRALIVDDEPLGRRGVRVRLAQEPGVEIAGECKNGREAVAAIQRLAPDLVFLDLQMPGLSGFDVIARIGPSRMPLVVFVTAHDEHALRAFEVEALDYLLKPIDDQRFQRALHRARARLGERQDGTFARKLSALLELEKRLAVRDRGRIVLVALAEVDRVEAEGDYVSVFAGPKSYLLRETMAAIEARLGPGFARIHRSSIVNVSKILELRPQPGGELGVVLQGGAELRASRGYADRLRKLIGDPL
jgi:two-component system, LytTR family, response regulator